MLVYLRDGFYSDNLTCYHAEMEIADQTYYFTQSQYTDTGPTISSADPITPGAWQGSHWSVSSEVTGMTPPGKIPAAQAETEPRTCGSPGGRFNLSVNEAVDRVRFPLSAWIFFQVESYQ